MQGWVQKELESASLGDQRLDARFRIALSRAPGEGAPDDVELLEEDMGVGFIDGDEIDLNEVVREQVYLHVPMKSVCRDDCAGLCAGCGADLNKTSCSCPPREGHPGFAALKNLKLVKE